MTKQKEYDSFGLELNCAYGSIPKNKNFLSKWNRKFIEIVDEYVSGGW